MGREAWWATVHRVAKSQHDWSSLARMLVTKFQLCSVSGSLRPHRLQHARLPYPSPTPGAGSNSCPSSWWYHANISSSLIPFSFYLQSCPVSGLFQWVSSSHQVAKVLKFQLQHQSFQWLFRTDFHWDWLVWSSCSPRASQEFSPTPQMKSINSSVLNFLYSPTLTSIHDYWKNHSFDKMDLGWQIKVSAF